MKGKTMNEMITLSKGGTKERKVKIGELQIPDCWHIYMNLKSLDPEAAQAVLDCWHIAHDLKRIILEETGSKLV